MDADRTAELLIDLEDEVLHAYRDQLGYLTIGVGHLIDPRKGGKISQRISRLILAEDMASCLDAARKYEWFSGLNDARQAVVLSMIFQLGAGGFGRFRATIAAIAAKDYGTAASQMLKSLWAQQTPARAQRMSRMMRTGEW
jgi:lysozyme